MERDTIFQRMTKELRVICNTLFTYSNVLPLYKLEKGTFHKIPTYIGQNDKNGVFHIQREIWRLRAEIRDIDLHPYEYPYMVIRRDTRGVYSRLRHRRELYAGDLEDMLKIFVYERVRETKALTYIEYLVECQSDYTDELRFNTWEENDIISKLFTIPNVIYVLKNKFIYKDGLLFTRIEQDQLKTKLEGFYPSLPQHLLNNYHDKF